MTQQSHQDAILYQIIQRLAQEQGLDLIELNIGRHHQDTVIQVLADQPQGGISMEACSALNRSIVEAIDKEGILSDDGYSLEVSSPGLDRPLVTFKDFLRNLNCEVHLWLKEKLEGKMELQGIVMNVTQSDLTLFLKKEKKEITIPILMISKGLLVI